MTACATANPKDRVVAGKPGHDSYLMKKLLGLPGICGMRMPRGCVEQSDAGAPADAAAPDAAEPDAATADAAAGDAAASDGAIADAAADAAVDAAPSVDARDASPDSAVDCGADAAPPLACLTGEQIMTIRNWISGLSRSGCWWSTTCSTGPVGRASNFRSA